MSTQHGSEIKKPTPRRLFSLENLKSSDKRAGQPETIPEQHSEEQQRSWINSGDRERLTSSPIQDSVPKDDTTNARWDYIRQHVLVAAGKSAASVSPTPQPVPPFHYKQPSSASSSISFPSHPASITSNTTSASTSTSASVSVPPRPPSRSQTPKPGSRLAFAAKLGFKQVVDHAREAAVDENRKFAEDVIKACWAARSVDPLVVGSGHHGYGHGHASGKSKLGYMYGDSTVGSGTSMAGSARQLQLQLQMGLPFAKATMSSFASSVSGSGGAAASTVSLPGKKFEQQSSGPGSPYSNTFNSTSGLTTASASTSHLASASGGVGQYTTPSIKHLHQILWQASGTSPSTLRSVYLPHESLVLSALLRPFISSLAGGGNDISAKLEEERWLALDAFEVLVKTWPPANELSSAERCLWCTKAITVLPSSQLRSRILSALWGLTSPSENNHVFLSPDVIQSIACGVISLVPVVSPQQPQYQYQQQLQQPQQQPEPMGDVKILKEIIDHLAFGPLDEDALEDTYGGAKWDDKMDQVEDVRRLMISEAAVCCAEVGVRELRLWLIRFGVEEYWYLLPPNPTPIQQTIAARRVTHFCTAALSILDLPPNETNNNTRQSHTAAVARIVHLLDKVVIPEVDSLSDAGHRKDNKGKARVRERRSLSAKRDWAWEARRAVTRVVAEVLCCVGMEDRLSVGMGVGGGGNVRWAVKLVAMWYAAPAPGSGSGSGSDREWRNAFEEMLRDLVGNAEWTTVVNVLMGVVERLADDVSKSVMQLVFPGLMDRLVQDPPPPSLLFQPPSSRASSMYSSATPSPSPTPTQFHFHPYSNQQKPNLTSLLHSLSLLAPKTVFKPLFTLAASSREIVLANALCVVLALSAVVKDWWVRDAEMVGVALMSDVSPPSDRSGEGEKGKGMGQVLVMLELVRRLGGLRRVKDGTSSAGVLANELGGESARVGLVRFVVELEVRLAALIEFREKKAPIPLVQRMLICMLFREFRLLTRSLKPAPWLPTVLRWVEEYFRAQDECDDEIEGVIEEIRSLYELAKGNANSMHKRRTFAMMPTSYTPPPHTDNKEEQRQQMNIPEMLGATLKLVDGSLRKGFAMRAFKLLVTVSAMLSPVEWGRIAPLVWGHGLLLDGDGGGVMPLVCFLVMQCAEKNPLEFRTMVEADMRSSDDLVRLASIHKISLLTNWRFQLMSESHNILVDRAHRPFRVARAPLPFVPTDIGSPNYVHDTDSDYTPYFSGKTRARVRGKSARTRDAIPAELRRQLVEIGWVDDEGEADEKEVWIRTPVAMLPVALVERLDLQRMEGLHHHHQAMSSPAQPTSTPSLGGAQLIPLGASGSPGALGTVEGELLRRNSSSGGPTFAKRRAVFVPPLSLIFRVLAMMVYDLNYAVAAAARDTLLDLMRNDPALLLRPILDLLCEEQGQEAAENQKDVSQAVNVLTALLHTRHMLPPPMTHAVFNNLAGFLKYALRQTDSSFPSAVMRYQSGAGAEIDSAGTLNSFALTVPIMAQLARYVGELSIREIRRSKMEHFLVPYGTLWFGHVGVPGGPMFPKGLVDSEFGGKAREVNPFVSVKARAEGAIDPKLVSVVMIRIAQNMMFVDMLRKSAQDVVLVRKTMPRFVVPSLDGSEGMEDGGRLLELSDFVPFKKMKPESVDEENKAEKTLRVLSLVLARSYVTLVAQVFRCMSRNSNDREEMANFVDGLNRILLVHGDDVGIVGHVLIAFMVASARFRRLFTSGGGYALFMPVLAKIYAEFHQRIDIKLAIEYAIYRFYALHREAFLFQSVDAIAHVSALPETDATQYAARVYELFYSLRTGVTPTNLDPAGIHDINQSQEKEALLFHAAEDKPQTFLAAIRRGEAQTNGQIFFEIPDSYESSRLRMEDFVKLFLTIIAHDPSILRAQYFMRLFRFLAPHLYNASPQTQHILREGLVALGEIHSKPFSKSKAAEASSAIRVGEADVTVPSGAEAPDKNKNASNPNIMRLDFLFALTSVAQAGTHMPSRMARQAIEIAELILKDAPPETFEPLSTFFADLAKLIVPRGELSKPKHVIPFLQQMSPIIRAYTTTLNFTSVLETITRVSSTPPFANDPAFTRIVVHEVCAAGLEACELIASAAELSQMPFRTALVPLLAESVFLRGADVIGELEKRRPTFHLLAKVVLPLVLMLKTTDHLASESGKSEASHHSSLARSWVRLLFYAMTACQRSFRASDNLPLTRSKSRDKRNEEEKQWQAHLPTFITALQIIKVIVIRAEAEISTTLPDLWHRLAGFLRSVLMDGNAHFALRGSGYNDFSPSPSPSPSPRASAQVDKNGQLSFFDHLSGQLTIDTGSIIPSARPRAIDYALWSTLEFLCAYRSPLRLQLRLFTVEKVVALDQELKTQQRRASPFASPNTSTASRRVSTSVFAKPRRSGMFPSPDSSPRASRSPSMINELSIPSLHLSPGANSLRGRLASLEIPHSTSGGELRIPGYQYISPTVSPSTPRRGAYIQVEGEANQGPRIVHLGPTSPSALIPPPPLSPSGGGTMGVNNIRLMAQSTKIKSSVLIRATYRRIRTVQTFMGYDTLLPMPAPNAGLGITGAGLESDEISFVTWTRRSALEAVLNEMTHLEEEFEDVMKGLAGASGGLGGDDSAFMEAIPTLPNNPDGTIID